MESKISENLKVVLKGEVNGVRAIIVKIGKDVENDGTN